MAMIDRMASAGNTIERLNIGISMNYRCEDSGTERAYIDSPYFDFLKDMAVLTWPIVPVDSPEKLDGMLSRIDGLLFTGGLDLDPALWNQPVHPKTKLVHPRRQCFDLLLYNAAKRRRMPIMGICLGLQLINVAEGGTLYQHLPESPGEVNHGCEGAPARHGLNINPDSRMFTWLKKQRIDVTSNHHQGIDKLPPTLRAAAVADDGVTEAVELDDYPFLTAIQWHPERDINNPVNRTITEKFLQAAAEYRATVPS
jgi:putative glutamine amidotransferase